MKQHLKVTAISIAILFTITTVGCGSKPNMKQMPGGMPPIENQEETATAVKTETVKLSSIKNEYMYSGSIEPSDEVEVYSALSGKVAAVNYNIGDTVNAGDVLFTMDTTSLKNSVKVSEAGVRASQTSVATAENNLSMANGSSMQTQLENAKNAITSAENSLKNAQTSVDNAKIALDNAKINLDKAENDYNINKQLFDVGGLSEDSINNYQDVYEQAKNTYSQSQLSLEQANTQYKSAEDSLAQAKTSYDILANQTSKENIIKAQDNLEQAKAQLNSSKAQLDSSKQSLDDAVVKAPISGTVSQCNVTAGANLSQGTTPFVIIGTNSVDVKVNVAEQMIKSLNQGDNVRINIPTLSNEDFIGNISYVSPDANSDGTYEVKVNISNNDGSIKSGMFAQIYFTKEQSDNAVVIPRDSVITKDNESYVFTVENGTAKKNTVEIGIDNGDTVEITNGLTEGMLIVTEGQTYLTDGDIVNDVTNKTKDSSVQTTNNEITPMDNKR